MEVLEILAYIDALTIGIVLGLIGGGSILTVPILVYALALDTLIAKAYSLFVVGSTSLVGTIKNMIHKKLDYKIAVIFSVRIYCCLRHSCLHRPLNSRSIFESSTFTLIRDLVIMLFFAIIKLITTISMIADGKKPKTLMFKLLIILQ
jgi:hypothetical protein